MTTAVACTIDVQFQPPIVPADIPADRVDAARFLARALPGCRIEHLARPSMLALEVMTRAWTPSMDEGSGDGVPESELTDAPTSLFFSALAFCFDQHLPFALRPEVIAYLINHEIAETVKRNPATYRALYTRRSDGREEIEVREDSLVPGGSSDWGRAIALFEEALRKNVPDRIMDDMLPAYSTASDSTRVASLVAFMDSASPYFTYTVHTLCGIPRLRLLGTQEDWRLLLASARRLAKRFESDLRDYFGHLLPVLERLAEQADPAAPPDHEFWKSIYKHDSLSGGDRVTGWSTALVAYLKNPSGELVPKDSCVADWNRQLTDPFDGVPHDHFPMHVSTVPFTWNFLGTKQPMKLVGGVLGVDEDDGFVTPSLSYGIVHAERIAAVAPSARRERIDRAEPGRTQGIWARLTRALTAGGKPRAS